MSLSKTADATRLHPELARVASRVPRYDYANPALVRAEMRRVVALSEAAGFWHRFHDQVTWKDQLVPGSRVPVRVYEPLRTAEASPIVNPNDCIVFLHGGGFLVGDLDMEHPRCLEMCRLTGRRIVSVDYRLAPEHPFPAGLDDCATALSWVMTQAQREAGRVALIGYSAGGCLATALCLMRHNDGLTLPCLQALIYPVLDDRMDTPSMRAFSDTPGWDSVSAALSWRQYLGMLPASPYAAPARAERLDGLPRTYIMAAELDPLRDEALAFGTRLVRSNVPTEVHHFAGAFHGFDVLSSTKLATRARDEQYAVLRDALTL